MKTSVLIIAHNEERYIAQCIESVLDQTQPADEIVLVVHNSTDNTLKIAQRYPQVTIVPFDGPAGIVYARTKGFEHVTGDIIVCTDGDSYVERNWIATMSDMLRRNDNVLVGSFMKQRGTIVAWMANVLNRMNCVSINERAASWIWGPSMACWGRDKSAIIEILNNSISLSQQLHLSRNPDDYWLALFMGQRGNLEVTNATWVTQHTKERTSLAAFRRNRENISNTKIMKSYFYIQQ